MQEHVGCGWSLRETAVQAKVAGIADVSDVTLLNRLRQSENWLRQLCQQLWKDNGVVLEPALRGRPVRLVDATVVREPGKTGSQWRLHYSIRLPLWNAISSSLRPCRVRTPGRNSPDSGFMRASWCWPMPDMAILRELRRLSGKVPTYACASILRRCR